MTREFRTGIVGKAGSAAVACVAVAAVIGAAGCVSAPAADRIVYVVDETGTYERGIDRDALGGSGPATHDRSDVSEADRRKWVEENYGAAQAPAATESRRVVVRERYVPSVEVVRERVPSRVIYVERDRRWYDYVPPVTFGLSYWGGHGHRHGGWGWGAHWGWPVHRW